MRLKKHRLFATKEEAEAQLEFATEFVAAIKAYCEQRQ
jgi:hypothetical protein